MRNLKEERQERLGRACRSVRLKCCLKECCELVDNIQERYSKPVSEITYLYAMNNPPFPQKNILWDNPYA